MSERTLRAVETMPLVGGRICVDLVNTTGARGTASPRERLRTYFDLMVWSRRAGVLGAANARTLTAASARRSNEAAAVLLRVRGIREHLYRLMRAIAERRPPAASDVAWLERLWRRGQRRRSLVVGGHALEIHNQRDAAAFDGIIWPIVQSAVDLLTSHAVARLKRCGECDWLFVDDSKNQSRTWCKKECGDRVRARRHYRLIRGRQGGRHGGKKPSRLDRRMENVDGKSKRRSSG